MAWFAGSIYGTASLDSSDFTKGLKGLPPVAQVAFKAVAAAAAVATAAFIKTAYEADQFLKAFSNVDSIVDETKINMESLKRQILSLDSSLGNATDITEGYYQAFSAGAKTQEQATKITVQSAKLAKAARTDLTASVDILTTALNAYGEETYTAEQISDSFFTTVKEGKITGEQLAATVGKSIPLFASMGVELDQLNAAIATMTKQGVQASETTTQLNAIVKNFLKPTDELQKVIEAYGFTSGAAFLQTNQLSGSLKILEETTGGNSEKMSLLFQDVEALRGAMALTGKGGKILNETLDAMSLAAGSTDKAFSEQEKTFDTFRNELKNLQIEVGLSTRGIVSSFFMMSTDVVKSLRSSFDRFRGSFDSAFGLRVETGNLVKFTDAYRKTIIELDKEQKKQIKNQDTLADLMAKQSASEGDIARTLTTIAEKTFFATERMQKATAVILERRKALDIANDAIIKLTKNQVSSFGELATSYREILKLQGARLTKEQELQGFKIALPTGFEKSLSDAQFALEKYGEVYPGLKRQIIQTFFDIRKESLKSLSGSQKTVTELSETTFAAVEQTAKYYLDNVEIVRREVDFMLKSGLFPSFEKAFKEALTKLKEQGGEVSKEIVLPPIDTSSYTKSVETVSEKNKTFLEKLKEDIEQSSKFFDELKKEKLFEGIDFTVPEIESLSKALAPLKDEIGLSKEEAEKFIESFSNTDEAKAAIRDLYDETKETGKVFGTAADIIAKRFENSFEKIDGQWTRTGEKMKLSAQEVAYAIVESFKASFDNFTTIFTGAFDLIENRAAIAARKITIEIEKLNKSIEDTNSQISATEEEIKKLESALAILNGPQISDQEKLKDELNSLDTALKEKLSLLEEANEKERDLRREKDDLSLEDLETYNEGEFEISLAKYDKDKEIQDLTLEEEIARIEAQKAQKEAEVAAEKKRLEDALAAQQAKLATEQAQKQAFEAQQKALEEKRAKEKNDLEKKAFVAEKSQKIAKVVIDLASAIMGYTAAYSGIPFAGPIIAGVMSGIAGTLAGIQIGLISAQKFVPSFQTGGTMDGTGIARVNETGGELRLLPDGTQIIPTDISRDIAKNVGAGNIVSFNGDININNPSFKEKDDVDFYVEAIKERLGAELRQAV